MAIVEALSHGIPTVVSTFCAIAEKLRAADAAVVVDPTPESIAGGISTILRTPQRYSQRAIEFVRMNLAWSSIVDSYLRQVEYLRNTR
jgi:glycosyltransferase involved in cell wall biosynthesis